MVKEKNDVIDNSLQVRCEYIEHHPMTWTENLLNSLD